MVKKVFKKGKSLNISVDTIQLNEDIYVYKYVVGFNNMEFYGLCHKEDLKNLTEKFLIPDRLADYNVYYSDIIQFENNRLKEGYLSQNIYENYKIDFSVFFLEDKSSIPPLDKCIVLTEKHINIPNSSFVSNLVFLFEYGAELPLTQVVYVGVGDGNGEYEPLISDLEYNLEKTIEYLENNKDIKVCEHYVWEEDEIVSTTKIFSLTDIAKLNNGTIIFNNTIIDNVKVSYSGTKKDKYIEFYWFPTKQDWKEYYYQLTNYGFDVANKFLIDEILKIPTK